MDFSVLLLVYICIIGACVGSFLNVCIYRIPENRSIISPGSACPSCGKSIPFYLNIPVISWIMLLGKCRYCRTGISFRYPMIEALTAAFAALCYLRFGLTLEMVYWFVFISTLLTLSFIDIDHQILPDIITLPGIILFASSMFIVPEMTVSKTLIGIFAGGGFLYAVAYFYAVIKKREGMGGGDIKLLAMIGAAIGWQGVLFTIFAGSLLGTIGGIAVMIHNRIFSMQAQIPFGPFLSMGALIYLFWGDSLIHWYITLIRPGY